MNTAKKMIVLVTVIAANFLAFTAPAVGQDEVVDNLQLGIFGLNGEINPTLEFFTRDAFGDPHSMLFKQNPKGLFLHANSQFPAMLIHDNAAVTAMSVGDIGVGVGIPIPEETFHVYSSDRTDIGFIEARILIENDKSDTQVRTMLEMVNNGGTGMAFLNTDSGEAWTFNTNAQDNFNISRNGTGGAEFALRTDGSMRVGPGSVSNLFLAANGNLTIQGTLNQQSDRNAKEDFRAINAQDVLDKVVELPITNWKYKDDGDHVRHVGPMAQDFYSAFGLGQGETTIASVDTAGVIFAAIKALNDRIVEKEDRIQELEDQLAEIKSLVSQRR